MNAVGLGGVIFLAVAGSSFLLFVYFISGLFGPRDASLEEGEDNGTD